MCLFIEKIRSSLDKGGVVGAVFLDLKKAFDTVSHAVLCSQLIHFNFSVITMNWIRSYLSGRSQSVSIENCQSVSRTVATGVPQGSILGPIFFSLYINDLPTACPEVECIMYADDKVFVHGRSRDIVAAKLTKAMNEVASWLHGHCLHLNAAKN